MDKKLLLIVLGIVIAIGGAFAYVLTVGKAEEAVSTPTQPAASAPEPPQPVAQETATTATPGAYITYSAESIAATKGVKVLFFHAPWCPQCRQLEASIKAGKIPDNVTIMKVDYDASQDLRKKYGVTIQTTLVRVDDAGNLIKKHVAYDDPTLAAITPKILQ